MKSESGIKIEYAHAVKNPFDNSIEKPFELRTVLAQGFRGFCEITGDHITQTRHQGAEVGVGADPDINKAMDAAIFEAEVELMDKSQVEYAKRGGGAE